MNLENNITYSENDIIDGCLHGCPKMQVALYKWLCPRMYTVCLRYTTTPTEAEDVMQESFIKVFKSLHKFRYEGSFEGWARRIFVNTAIENFRRRKQSTPLTHEEETIAVLNRSCVTGVLEEKDVLKMVQKLSPGYRTVFSMNVIEGYSHKEISAMLGISEGTSKSQLSRAKTILQSLLKKSNAAYN